MQQGNERLYFFCDIDGTLLHEKVGKYEPKQHNVLTIQNFVERGHAFVMATGRGIADVKQIAGKLNVPVEYAITYNGAFVYKKNEEISSNTLTVDQLRLIVAVAMRSKIKYDETLLYSETGDVYVRPNTLLSHVHTIGTRFVPGCTFKPWKKNTMRKLVKKNIRIPKICFASHSPDVTSRLERKFQLLFRDRLSVYRSSSHSLEICDAGVDKASAIRLIMQRENVGLGHVAFVGDSGNDVSAFRALKHAYIMAHATNEYAAGDMMSTPDVAGAIAHFVDVYRSEE